MFGFHYRTAAVSLFALDVIRQHRGVVPLEILALQPVLMLDFVRQEAVGPNLSMRMRIRAAHRGAFVFKNLHPRIAASQIGGLFLPGGNHSFQRLQRQFRQGLAVIGRETNHPAGATGTLAAHQRILTFRCQRGIRHQRSKVVGEHVGVLIVRVFIAGNTGVARAEETVGIVLRQRFLLCGLLLALPRPFGTVWRDQYPLAGQRVVAAMGMIYGVKIRHGGSFFWGDAARCNRFHLPLTYP
ncbi:hypothetical protein D3C72_1539880 [compost metagenome]